jgi:hypothetical protein
MAVYDGEKLRDLLHEARKRRRLKLAFRGTAIICAAGAAILLLTGWAASEYRSREGALLILRLGALLSFGAIVYLALVRPLTKRISDARLARLIEERSYDAEDRFVTAVEFSDAEGERRASRALVTRLVTDADGAAAAVNLDNVVRRRTLAFYAIASLVSFLLFFGVIKWGPRDVAEGVAQLVAPSGLAASPNALAIKVKPGTSRVPKGSDQEITATLVNFESDNVTFFSRLVDAKDAEWQGQPMEPAKARGDFQFSIFNIQDATEYFVESNGVRSEVFKLVVVDLSFVKQLDLTLNFPSYTGLPTKTIEDGGDIAALKGTVASITARLSKKAKAARIVFRDGRKVDMRDSGDDFVGSLTVTADTSYYIELVSLDGETYRGSNEYDISVLEDQPPSITFDRPGRDTKATNLEEVFTQARAEDDYGVAGIEMFFSVNGGAEQKLDLQQLNRDAERGLTGAHTFFLEEFKLKPGDFISYYAKARDAANETTSDIYFIEIKPFEMQYKQAQQQGGGGDGAGGEQNALTRRQKELIAATHRLMREGTKYQPQERADGYEAVAAGQEKLRADTLEFVDRVGRRLGEQIEGREELARMADYLKQAAREMENAPPPLRKQAGKDALPPEQRALQRLLAADAVFREMQVAFGNDEGGGGGERESQELTDLFELELDKMKNQYETLRREQQQRAQQQKSEAERRLEELARRQQQALEEQRRRQRQGQPRSGGGGGGGQRQQQELIEEARRAARELERLSRERRDAQLQELSRQLNQAADDMQRSQASSDSNSNESIAQGERALEKLQQAQRRLQQMRGGGQQGRKQEIGELSQRASEAASRQREIARDVENLARRGGQNSQESASRGARERLAERKDALADSVNNLEKDIEQSARSMSNGQSGKSGQQRAARQLSDAAEALRRDRVADRIRSGKRNLENNQLEQARAGERALEQSLNELSERLQAAQQSAGRSGDQNGEETLDRTRRLADDLESLRRRMGQRGQEQAQAQGQRGQEQGQRQGQRGQEQGQGQRGQEQGQQGQRGQQQSQQQGGQSQGGRAQESNDFGGTGDDSRQLRSEFRERLRDAEGLRREWGTTSGVSVGKLGEIVEQLRRMADGTMKGDAQTAAALKSQVIDPLRQLELELSRRMREQLGRTNLRLNDEGAAPERYRKSVEEYYKRLSGGGKR